MINLILLFPLLACLILYVFKKDYLNTLEDGEHTLKIAFNDGGIATTNFIIEEEDTTSGNPATGDSILLWISLMAFSTLGIVGIAMYKKEK